MSNDYLCAQTGASLNLADLGWRQFYNQQLLANELEIMIPVRVMAVHRNGLHVRGRDFDKVIQHYKPADDDEKATIGDWLLIDPDKNRAIRRLERMSLFKRKAPGTARSTQLIAANVDTLMIVSSCNHDFNIARLERYLALAQEASVSPIVVLTKADQAENPDDYRMEAEKLLPNLCVETLNATNAKEVKVLSAWCKSGQTIAFVGSSGVGKSTLANTLLGKAVIETNTIREDDSKGRHTTTRRELYRLPIGCWVLDTPGIRELQLTDVEQGIADVFSDIENLSSHCRFRNCDHLSEPGCAVKNAIESGDMEKHRVKRWRKLVAENERNSLSIAEARAKDKAFGKMIKATMNNKKVL